MELKGKKFYYILEGETLTPQLKKLKREFDEAVKRWNEALEDLESDDLTITETAIERLQRANEDLARIKQEIKNEKAAQN